MRRINANRFSVVADRDGERVCGGSASVAGAVMGHGKYRDSMSDEPRGGMNEAVSVKADDQQLSILKPSACRPTGAKRKKLTFQGARQSCSGNFSSGRFSRDRGGADNGCKDRRDA